MENRNQFVDALRTKDTFTENGQPTNSSSLSASVDLFFTLGAVRAIMRTNIGKNRVIAKFEQAMVENPLIAMKLLFWARNVRGGAGERNVFRTLVTHMAEKQDVRIFQNIHNIAYFGRWDDMIAFMDTVYEKYAIDEYAKALKTGHGLAAKWAPRLGGKNNPTKKRFANKLRASMNLTAKDYRKLIVEMTDVVETAMCQKDWSKIDYEKVPSLAMTRYNKAFSKHDWERFSQFGKNVTKGDAKINVKAIYPYDLIKTLRVSRDQIGVVEAQWAKQIDYLEDSNERLFTMVDVSGSMKISRISGDITPMDVAVSLGLYISERTKGPYKDAFMTFSKDPRIQYVKGSISQKMRSMMNADWGMNTNLEKAFTHILEKSRAMNVPPEQMPTILLILSDMEFDSCVSTPSFTAMENIKEQYAAFGYEVPKVVFWNIENRHGNTPVNFKEDGTALVSGLSPSILKGILKGNITNPYMVMLDTINDEDYNRIVV